MKHPRIIVFALLLACIVTLDFAKAGSTPQTATIELPPASLAAWYKPQNKRQVWLHTMFRLGQSFQAVRDSAEGGDGEALNRWAGIFTETYGKLTQMVPEWAEEVDGEAATALSAAASQGDVKGVKSALRKLGHTCRSCHGQYKLGVVALLRAPDFSGVEIPGSPGEMAEDYHGSMKILRRDLARLKTAREDGQMAAARTHVDQLKERLMRMAKSCSACHRGEEPQARILGEHTFQVMDQLKAALVAPHDPTKSGRLLGEFGYTVCGRCHSIHRSASAIRHLLQEAAGEGQHTH
ncbi:MAG: cytochrome c [Magnetococcales bacterium]|nr:cytochrome c [Magnetococcales bacterium]